MHVGSHEKAIRTTVKAPRMKTKSGRKSFCASAANFYSNVSIFARQLDFRILFRAHLDDLHAFVSIFT